MLKKLKNFGWGYILIGVLLIAIGVCFISIQDAYETLALVTGAIITVTGIGFGIYTLMDKKRGVKFTIKLSIAVAALICGVVTMCVKQNAIDVIANILCLLLIVDGSFKLQLSILSRRPTYYGWWIVTTLSVAIIISAFLLCKFTPNNPATLATLSGIVITSDGLLNILSAFFSPATRIGLIDAEDEAEETEDESKDGAVEE
ncbi:MAG: DUF308 domain-containing protein [Clostridia bacterium]|nr:DUF308 domain-containing protein [Clostridia bacterium]